MIGLESLNQSPPPEQQQPSKQSLLLDGLRRVEQHSPVWMLPRLVTTLNLHQHLAQARQRLCDSHREMMKDTGVDVAESCGDGGISVKGDTTINGLGTLGTLAVVAASLIGGGGIGAAALTLWGARPKPQPVASAPVESVDDWKLGLRVTDNP